MSMREDGRPVPSYQPPDEDHVAGEDLGESLGGGDVAGAAGATLSAEEQRVLGSLLEKAQATPDHYPLTLNSLASACNQKSNREPVLEYDDEQILTALDGLQEKRFATRISVAGSRVPKFKHTLESALPEVDERGTAMLTVLLLRGRQTLGELRTRTERLFHFSDLDAAQACLDELLRHSGRPLVKHLPVGDGKRVPTFVHLLGDSDSSVTNVSPGPTPSPAPSPPASLSTEVAELRAEVSALRSEVAALKQALGE